MNAFGDINKKKEDVEGEEGQQSQEEGGGTVTSRAGQDKNQDLVDPNDPLGQNKKRIDVTEAEYKNIAMSESRDVEANERGKYTRFKAIIQSKANEKLPILKSKEELEDEAERLLK